MKPSPSSGAQSAGETVLALRALGFTDRDQVRLRFSFEESSLRAAVDLAAELRTLACSAVHVRPGRWRLNRGGWTVALTTREIPMSDAVVRLWADEMQAIAERRAGCRLTGCRPLIG